MACFLRASGKRFDVDRFAEQSSLRLDALWRAGEQRFASSASNSMIHHSAGIRIVASDADFSELRKQIEEVTSFLKLHHDDLKKLTTFSGVEEVMLDFGAWISPPGWASFVFPPELLALAGSAGVALSLSVYPTDGEV